MLEAVDKMWRGLTRRATGESMDDAGYRGLRTFLISQPILRDRLPEFVRKYRSIEGFWGFIQPKFTTYQERRDFLRDEFEPLLSALESGRLPGPVRVEVSAAWHGSNPLAQQFIDEQILKCKQKLANGDYDGAITNARTLLEAVLREIEIRSSGKDPPIDGDLRKQYKRVTKFLNLDPNQKGLDAAFVEILRGFISVVNGLARLRNTASDAHARSYRPEQHHARLAVNSAHTVVDFLFGTYEYQKQKRTGTIVAEESP